MDEIKKNQKVLRYGADMQNSLQDSQKKEINFDIGEEALNKAENSVYQRGRKPFNEVRKKVNPAETLKYVWNTKWHDNKTKEMELSAGPVRRVFSVLAIGMFSLSLVLLLGALAYAYFSFISGGYAVRQDKIEMTLEIPNFTSSGKDLSGQIFISNTNRTLFENAYVSLQAIEDPNKPPRNIAQIDIGNVESGDKIYKNINLSLSGLEGESKQVVATLFYKVPQSESVFQKVITQSVIITKSPVTMTITGPKSLSIAQDGEYSISVRGISKVVPALIMNLDIPKQMKLLKTNFPEIGKGVFSLGPLNEGEQKVFTFTASFQNQPEIGSQFTINAKAGSGDGSPEDTKYFTQSTYGIALSQSPIKIFVVADGAKGDSGEKITFSSKQPKLKIVVENQGTVKVVDANIALVFSGGLLKSKEVSVDGAEYDANKNTAFADSSTNVALKEIAPGERVEFAIQFNELSDIKTASGRNLYINTTFTSNTEDSKGKSSIQRITTTLTPEEFSSVALSTNYFSGPFKNTGPMPAKVGQKTTYTILMDVDTNSGFSNGKLIIPLPSYVEFIKGLDNTITFNKLDRTVTWNIGNLSKATSTLLGINRKDSAIQVSILPSPDQVNTVPQLTKSAHFDSILNDKTNTSIPAPDATINISSDPKYVQGKGYESVGE